MAKPNEPRVAWRSVALPVEHGGWGLLLEPLFLGLVLAPSWAGACLAVGALSGFLARHPLRLALADGRRGQRYPRTALAERFGLLYSGLALAGLAGGVWLAAPLVLAPLAAAAPIALIQLAYDARHRGRQWLPEVAGGVALGSVASAVALAGGWPAGPAAVLWLLSGARALSSVVYVRVRVRATRATGVDHRPVWWSHAACLVLTTGLARVGWCPWLAVVAFAILLLRAVHGLAPARRVVRPQAVGVQEMGYGFLTTLLLALGYGLGV